MMTEHAAPAARPVLFLISSCGEPLLLVPAESVADAQARFMELLRVSPAERHMVASYGVRVTIFSPSVVADGHALAYTPTADGQFSTGNEPSGSLKNGGNRRTN